MIGIRAGSVAVSCCAFALAAGAVYAQRGVSLRAAPAYALACERIAPDRAQVRNVGKGIVPSGVMVEVRAPGSAGLAGGELHASLRPGDVWSPVSRLPVGFASCEATVAAKPLTATR